MGFEPTRPVRGDRVSTATRPAVSGSRPYFEPVEPRGVEPRRRVCKTQLPPASDPVRSVTGVGVEPTLDRLSTCRLYQLAYPVIQSRSLGLEPSSPGI